MACPAFAVFWTDKACSHEKMFTDFFAGIISH